MNGLITFYRHRLKTVDGEDEKCQAVKACLSKGDFDEAVIVSLLDDLKQFVITTPQDYIVSLRRLLTCVLLYRFHEGVSTDLYARIRSTYRKVTRSSYWEEFQLGFAFSQLIVSLLHERTLPIDVKQLTHGATLTEGGAHTLDGQIFDPQFGAELALCWIMLGWKEENDELIAAGLKGAHFLIHLCDRTGAPFTGIWLQEGTFSPRMLYSAYALLFAVAAQFDNTPSFQSLEESMLRKLERQTVSSSVGDELLYPLLALLIQKENMEGRAVELDCNLSFNGFDRSLGFLRYDSEDMSLSCCASGVNTGLGALHKKQVKVASFGPHFYPLADSDRYGLYRTSNGSQQGFKDLKLQVEEEGSIFSGWSRLISPLPSMVANQNFTFAIPGDHWIFFDIQTSKSQAKLDIALSKCDPVHPLAFTFFVHAQKASIEGKEPYLPRSLRQYQGNSAPIVFQSGDEALVIEPEFYDNEMLIIPLAGKNHFWGADFLLAFPIQEKLLHHRWRLY